jgi:hypothetical protein
VVELEGNDAGDPDEEEAHKIKEYTNDEVLLYYSYDKMNSQ